jgi:FkbM family methyltransferase
VLARAFGLVRSLALYHGIPGRARRMRAFYAPFVPPGSLCFDVGAHVGNRTRCFRALGARVVAVEPQPDCAALLASLFARDSGVTLLRAALGEAPGRATLMENPVNPTVGTLDTDWVRRAHSVAGFETQRWEAGAEVEVTTLDALIATHGEPAFVKIDVEGFEAAVLRGLSRPVPALSFEVLPALRERAFECLDRLDALGRYEFEWSTGERLRLERGGWMTSGAMRDWLQALPAHAPSGDVYARLTASSVR